VPFSWGFVHGPTRWCVGLSEGAPCPGAALPEWGPVGVGVGGLRALQPVWVSDPVGRRTGEATFEGER
jgi:hypothetical protein